MSTLLLHGAGGGGWEWNVWRRALRVAGHAVHAPDLTPDAGGVAATRIEHYLAQVANHAAQLSEPRILVGASLGGLLALATAAQAGASAVVLVNPMPPAPESALLAPRPASPAVIPWGRDATLEGTRRALPDADDSTCLYAMRRWRDESGTVLDAARAGLTVAVPSCPVLVIGSDADDEIPCSVSRTLAARLAADFVRVPGSHVGPLLGRDAIRSANLVSDWLRARLSQR